MKLDPLYAFELDFQPLVVGVEADRQSVVVITTRLVSILLNDGVALEAMRTFPTISHAPFPLSLPVENHLLFPSIPISLT